MEAIDRDGAAIIARLKPHVDDYGPLAKLLIERFQEQEINLETAFMTLTQGISA
ncbi:MAG: hypothetical protein WEA31_11010 [Pirellulales bacterium]